MNLPDLGVGTDLYFHDDEHIEFGLDGYGLQLRHFRIGLLFVFDCSSPLRANQVSNYSTLYLGSQM